MIGFDTANYHEQTMLVSFTCTTGYATGDYVFDNVVAYSNVDYYIPPRPRLPRDPAPAITDRRRWREAERVARDRAPPQRQRRRYLDDIMRTKTINRRFT